jgi:hypothetical protein
MKTSTMILIAALSLCVPACSDTKTGGPSDVSDIPDETSTPDGSDVAQDTDSNAGDTGQADSAEVDTTPIDPDTGAPADSQGTDGAGDAPPSPDTALQDTGTDTGDDASDVVNAPDADADDAGTVDAGIADADGSPADLVTPDVAPEDTGAVADIVGPDNGAADVVDAGDSGAGGPVIEGCEPTGPGQHIHSVEFVPANPDNCTETVAVIHGVHPGLGYGFGTTNTGKCQPPFNCGVEAKLTLSLSASKSGDNPDGPEYAHELKLGTLEAYSYCVVGKYTAPGGISETIQSTIAVTPCL